MSLSKPHVLVLAFALSTTAAVPDASAQPPGPPPASEARGFDVQARLSELRQRLMLDASQSERVRAILESARARLIASRQGSVGPRDATFRLERRQILWDVEDQIWALLTCPQKDAFRLYVRERFAARMDHAMDERGHGPGRGPGRGHGPGGWGPRRGRGR